LDSISFNTPELRYLLILKLPEYKIANEKKFDL